MHPNHRIRTAGISFLIGVCLVMLIYGFTRLSTLHIEPRVRTIDVRGTVAETGGWEPGNFTARVGEPVRIRLTSGDMLHGFAIGQMDVPAVDVIPGETSEVTLTFDRPGKYVYYCTRWCGLGHWRMRGTIEVEGTRAPQPTSGVPLYVHLSIDIDAPHQASVVPRTQPAAGRGEALGVAIPTEYASLDYYRSHSPAQLWQALRALSETQPLSDAGVWDVVAFVWASHTNAQALTTGKQLYAENCAACHGDRGAGDGAMAVALGRQSTSEFGSATLTPTNFTDPTLMLGASPALLQGKIMRGGMGTGMPYWGPVFTDPQTWALIDYLWTFQMGYSTKPSKDGL
ncbi:MAG: c-type cytochrome [Chloroflexi bacterium]|nr:c-type cytochrome [Chloroflexota bacterium]